MGFSRCRCTLSFSVSCCQVAGVVLFLFCFHIMLFCSEFTSEEFSSPRTLWFSCLGVRELWMLRESSSLVGAFTGSSSLFWELGSSYPGRGGGGGLGAESTVRTTTTVSCSVATLAANWLFKTFEFFFKAFVANSDQPIRTSSETLFIFVKGCNKKSSLSPKEIHPHRTILHITIPIQCQYSITIDEVVCALYREAEGKCV